jgi:peptidyl-prolyl cis-trans isomerase B (cyclophilin B)
MRKGPVIFGVVASAVLLSSGCTSSGTLKSASAGPADPAETPVADASTDASPGSTNAARSWSAEPAMDLALYSQYTMKLHTSQGDIVVKLDVAKAPHTVNSFKFLAGQKFFDGSYCHRLATGAGLKMLQCGDPDAGPAAEDTDGDGGPGYTFQDENLKGATYHAGTAAMANAGPNSNGSQFFLVFGDSELPPAYTPFGTITSGMDVLARVAAAGVEDPGPDGTGRPKLPVELETVTVTSK